MKLHPSRKVFNKYKCDYPENIIKKIEKGFKKIGLEISYLEKKFRSDDVSFINTIAKIKGLGTIAEGGNFSPIVAKAKALAEMAERFSSREISFYAFPSVKNITRYNAILKDILEMNFLKGFTKINESDQIKIDTINSYFKEKISQEQYNIIKNQKLLDSLVDCYSFTKKCYEKVPINLIEVMSTSNGVASGSTIEEALVQASCEIFERYVALEVVTKKIQCPTVKLDSIKDDNIFKFIKMFNSMNIEIYVKDFSSIKDLPVTGVLFINHNTSINSNKLKKDHFNKRLIVGSHPNIIEAISGCFSEYIQLASDQDDLQFGRGADILYDFWIKKLGKKYKGPSQRFEYFFHYYDYFGDLSFLEKGETISFNQVNIINNSDCLDDFKFIISICEKNNWDLRVVDYTHKILKFPTVRIIITPISTDYNPDVREALNFINFEERFNYFYGIKDFYDYYHDDNWIKDKKNIETLIENLEEYLSKNLLYYHIWIHLGVYQQFVNLFYILAFAYLALGRYDQSLEYFKVLLELEDKPDFLYEHSDIVFNYTPSSISTIITLLEKIKTENKKMPKFTFKSNPFKREKIGLENSEYLFTSQLKSINESFF